MFGKLFSSLEKKPKGFDNPYSYYPSTYSQDSRKSVTDPSGKYDLTKFSTHESSIIKQAIRNTKRKYPAKYQAIGLANESYVVTYKPRYVLFEIVIILFGESQRSVDQAAVSFAYLSKGAQYRREALRYYEAAKETLNLDIINEFSSVSVLSYISQIADAYEKEHEYKKAIECLRILVKYGSGNTALFRDKIKTLQSKNTSPVRRRKMPESQAEFERNVHIAAQKFISAYW